MGRDLWLANSYSRRHWCFVQAATMLLPAIGLEVEAAGFRRFYQSLPFQRLVSSVAVEIGLEKDSFDSRSAAVQNRTWSRNSRRIVPMSLSTNGCDSGMYGTVLI